MQLMRKASFPHPVRNKLRALGRPWVWTSSASSDVVLAVLQVYDLQEYRPGAVLRKIWKNFEAQERNGDTWAPIVRG